MRKLRRGQRNPGNSRLSHERPHGTAHREYSPRGFNFVEGRRRRTCRARRGRGGSSGPAGLDEAEARSSGPAGLDEAEARSSGLAELDEAEARSAELPSSTRPKRDRADLPGSTRPRRDRAVGPGSRRSGTLPSAALRARGHPHPARSAFPQGRAIKRSSTAFCACKRFSAWSKTMLRSPSRTSSVISSPRWAGRQCITNASALCSSRAAFTW